jgi:hypothetical protein
MSASWALQQAIYATLSSDDGVKALLGDPPRVFDAPPRDAAFPYCVIGDDAASDWSTATEQGSEHIVSVHVWSRASGHREAKLIADAVQDALDGAELSVTGQSLIDLRWLDTNVSRDADGETVRAALRFRAVLEPHS